MKKREIDKLKPKQNEISDRYRIKRNIQIHVKEVGLVVNRFRARDLAELVRVLVLFEGRIGLCLSKSKKGSKVV